MVGLMLSDGVCGGGGESGRDGYGFVDGCGGDAGGVCYSGGKREFYCFECVRCSAAEESCVVSSITSYIYTMYVRLKKESLRCIINIVVSLLG